MFSVLTTKGCFSFTLEACLFLQICAFRDPMVTKVFKSHMKNARSVLQNPGSRDAVHQLYSGVEMKNKVKAFNQIRAEASKLKKDLAEHFESPPVRGLIQTGARSEHHCKQQK